MQYRNLIAPIGNTSLSAFLGFTALPFEGMHPNIVSILFSVYFAYQSWESLKSLGLITKVDVASPAVEEFCAAITSTTGSQQDYERFCALLDAIPRQAFLPSQVSPPRRQWTVPSSSEPKKPIRRYAATAA